MSGTAGNAPPSYQSRFESLLEKVLNDDKSQPIENNNEQHWFEEDPLTIFVRLSAKLRDANASELYLPALYGLMRYKTNPKEAGQIARTLEFHATQNAPIWHVCCGVLIFLAALLVCCLIWFPTAWWFSWPLLPARDFALVSVSGLSGAIISLAMRREQFAEASGKTPAFYKSTGALLPLIGTVFACVVYSIFLSGMIDVAFGNFNPSQLHDLTPDYLAGCVVIGFLSGFSERFAVGFLGRVSGDTSDRGAVRTAGA